MTPQMPPLSWYALKTLSMSSLRVKSPLTTSTSHAFFSSSEASAGRASTASFETRLSAVGNELWKLENRRAENRTRSVQDSARKEACDSLVDRDDRVVATEQEAEGNVRACHGLRAGSVYREPPANNASSARERDTHQCSQQHP